MARVNVETIALKDHRMKVLGRLIGGDHRLAIGHMVYVWDACQERGTTTLTVAELSAITDIPDFAVHLIASKLGRRTTSDRVYVCGSKERLGWLKAARENGKAGGRPKKNQTASKRKPSGYRRKNPLSLSLPSGSTSNSTSTSLERERDAAASDGKTELSGKQRAWIRQKVREIRTDTRLIELSAIDPDLYVEEVRDLTGWSPDELADMTGDDAIRPHRKETPPHAM